MARQVFAYMVHRAGKLDDTAFELVTAARTLDPEATVTALITGSGLKDLAKEAATAYPQIWKVDNKALAYPNAETIRTLLEALLPAGCILLLPNNTFGMDLGPGLAIKMAMPYISDALAFEGMAENTLLVLRQEYSGMVNTRNQCDLSGGAVINVRPGAFQADESKSQSGQIIDKTNDVGDIVQGPRRFLEVVEVEAGDVDITKSEILVSVGRGIEDEENLEIIHDLAEAMGGDVSCSRPIVDAKWLEKFRQVGTSGQTVKPRVYMALGISGSFQHLGGLKGAPFVVAVNKNPKAPIFQVADVGVVDDILDFVPALTARVNEIKG